MPEWGEKSAGSILMLHIAISISHLAVADLADFSPIRRG
jgi:hypothetical protein